MKTNRLLYPVLALALAVPAGAQTFKINSGKMTDGSLKGRENKSIRFSSAAANGENRPFRTIGYGGDAISEIDKLGTLVLRLEEDFSLMSAGSIEAPAKDVNIEIDWEDPDFTYPWWNLRPEFTHQPHWGTGAEWSTDDEGNRISSYACPAGGCYYMEMAPKEYMGQVYVLSAHINTPNVKVDENGALAVVEFRARTRNAGETYDGLLMEFGETNNMGPTWRTCDNSVVVTDIPAEWTTYRVLFREGGPTTLINFVGMTPGNVYLDDIKVYQLVPKVMYPVMAAHTNYKGTSFTVNWQPVEGADSYLLSVYSVNPDGSEAYVLKDQPASGTSYDVTGTVSGEIYYCSVKSVKGQDVSVASPVYRVYDLEVPVLNPAVHDDLESYIATWNDVPGADVYNYMALDKRPAEQDGVFVVTEEDFTGVTDFNGNRTGLTKEDPDRYTISGKFYVKELKQQGWYGESCMPYDDYMAFDAYHYTMKGENAGFISPEFDMSKDGGKFVIECDLAAQTDEDGYTTECTVAVFNWNEARGDYDQVETQHIDGLDLDWKRCRFELTSGTEKTVFGIFAVNSFGNLYVDNLKVTQNYKKGDYLMEPFRFANFHGKNADEVPTEIQVQIPPHALGYEIYHTVSAYGRLVDQYMQAYDDRQSAFAPLEFVMKSVNGIENVTDEASEAPAEYYTIDGYRVSNPEATPGLYIVRRGNETSKVLVK